MFLFLRNFTFLLLAFFALVVLFIPLFIIQTIRHIIMYSVTKFFYGVAVAIDYLFGYLLFGYFGLTVSTIVYMYYIEKGKLKGSL